MPSLVLVMVFELTLGYLWALWRALWRNGYTSCSCECSRTSCFTNPAYFNNHEHAGHMTCRRHMNRRLPHGVEWNDSDNDTSVWDISNQKKCKSEQRRKIQKTTTKTERITTNNNKNKRDLWYKEEKKKEKSDRTNYQQFQLLRELIEPIITTNQNH